MTLSGFAAYSGALAIAAIIPGPQIVAIVAQALRSGYRQAAWMTAGMVLGDVLYLAAVLAGLAFIAETFSFLLIAIKWAGVVYLCFLAVQFWKAGGSFEASEGGAAKSGGNAFLSGVLVTLGNPKSVLFYISILPTVVDIGALSVLDVPALLAITAIILAAVQFPFAVAGAGTRRTLQSPRATRLFNRGAAVCMGGAAATIALRN
ncbi:LysE family translocator [Mesorhizobium sp.]|uniref:LysE family translocator n=1 Tax=Mesorhizobium sp. TaxID=1871066 RepID=UPI000FE30ADC|nr:LysE family translocator [Mesorhizobium sp.]RWA64601.1 MAG: LysE family translocator [Mesorhizobium sp.]RWB95472.1 MAG: LysE family translocator [Mesorhizobium sp.]RWG77800.1 MAG: LysE family translocator [Mesorhizobium sp.]RWG79120.1 MAG: LysE family translocator [Mesorhizobium sp.]RWK00021.1 MAG: LysE family translocator [Mesorhizobium sp.]